MKRALLLLLIVLAPAVAVAAESGVPEPAPAAPASTQPAPELAALFEPAPQSRSETCEASLHCQGGGYIGYLHCTGNHYCSVGTWSVDCDGNVQHCQCGYEPEMGFCP